MSNLNDFRVKNGMVVATTATIQSTAPATSTITGALIVAGGMGIGGTLFVGSLRADASTSATTWAVYYNPVTKELTTSTVFNASTGTTSTFFINNSTTSVSTTTGALVVKGGAGIGDSVYVGNRVGFVNTANVSVVYQVYNPATNSLDTVFG